MPIKEDIKSLIVKAGWTMGAVVEELNKRYGYSETLPGLSRKLSQGTIQYKEVLHIAEITGYEMSWIKR